VDSGWIAVRARQAMAGNSRLGFTSSGLEATVKDCGVAVAMPQGQQLSAQTRAECSFRQLDRPWRGARDRLTSA